MRDRIRTLIQQGKSGREIATILGISASTVSYHRKRLDRPYRPECARRHDWDAVQACYDEGHSIRECMAHFGFSAQTWHQACKRGAVNSRPKAMPIAQLLVGPRSRSHLKRRLLSAGLLDPCCEECGIDQWRDQPLALELHHRNGDGQDNRLENLSLLCPNCHSQTASWGGRNRSRAAASQ